MKKISVDMLKNKMKMLMKNKIAGIAAIVLLVIIVVAILISVDTSTVVTSRIVHLGLSDIGMLETQIAYFTNVQTIEKARDVWGWTVPFTTSKYIFSYDGTVRAGINFENVVIEVDESNHVVTVAMPLAEIIDVNVNPESLEIYDESRNAFSPLKVDDLNNSLVEVEREAEEQSIANGILESAQENAKTLVKAFLSQSYDMEVYTIEFK